MENNKKELITAEEIRSRITEIEKQMTTLTSSGSSSALGGLIGLGAASLIPALIPGIGWAIGAVSAATGAGIASVFLKKKRELQMELEELKIRLQLLESVENANK
jgi:uncharacterized membrane protein